METLEVFRNDVYYQIPILSKITDFILESFK